MAEEAKKYSLDKKGLMLKHASIVAGGVIAGGSLFLMGGCGKRSEQWAETSGQAGRINLEAVEEAMQKSKDVSEFERRVNEIYQGDEVVLIEVRNESNGEQLISGYADLNDNSSIDYNEDEKLFTFRRWYEEGNLRGEMRGYGVNNYYYRPYPTGMDFLTTWLLFSALTRPMYAVPVYHTTIPDVQTIKNYRTTYRATPSYRDQININRNFESRMSATHGTTYRKASPGATRQAWAARKGINLSKATRLSSEGFGGSRSSWGKASRGFFGGFKGGGTGGGIDTCYM